MPLRNTRFRYGKVYLRDLYWVGNSPNFQFTNDPDKADRFTRDEAVVAEPFIARTLQHPLDLQLVDLK